MYYISRTQSIHVQEKLREFSREFSQKLCCRFVSFLFMWSTTIGTMMHESYAKFCKRIFEIFHLQNDVDFFLLFFCYFVVSMMNVVIRCMEPLRKDDF